MTRHQQQREHTYRRAALAIGAGFFLMGAAFIAITNTTAVKATELRSVERTIAQQKDDIAQLRIAEARARSLAQIAQETDELVAIDHKTDVRVVAARARAVALMTQ